MVQVSLQSHAFCISKAPKLFFDHNTTFFQCKQRKGGSRYARFFCTHYSPCRWQNCFINRCQGHQRLISVRCHCIHGVACPVPLLETTLSPHRYVAYLTDTLLGDGIAVTVWVGRNRALRAHPAGVAKMWRQRVTRPLPVDVSGRTAALTRLEL